MFFRLKIMFMGELMVTGYLNVNTQMPSYHLFLCGTIYFGWVCLFLPSNFNYKLLQKSSVLTVLSFFFTHIGCNLLNCIEPCWIFFRMTHFNVFGSPKTDARTRLLKHRMSADGGFKLQLLLGHLFFFLKLLRAVRKLVSFIYNISDTQLVRSDDLRTLQCQLI